MGLSSKHAEGKGHDICSRFSDKRPQALNQWTHGDGEYGSVWNIL